MRTDFSRKIHSRLPPGELWEQVTAAIRDSVGHPFWPTEFEQSHSARFRTNGLIQVTYKSLFRSEPVTYRILKLLPEQRVLQYEATENHPLRGGATLRVLPLARGGSELHWSGTYAYPWYSPAGLYLPYFLNRFFAKLKRNLRAFESEKRYQSQFAQVHRLADRRRRRRGIPS